MNGKKRPSILMVHSRSSWGGNTAMVLALSQGLGKAGIRVGLAVHPHQPCIEPFQRSGIPVHILPIGGKSDMLAPLRLARLVREKCYDLLHSHTRPADLAAVMAACLAQRPVIITQHGNINLDRRTLARRYDLFAFAYNVILRNADRVVAVCNATKTELINQCHVPASKIRVVYNGLDMGETSDIDSRQAIRATLGISKEATVGIITGSIHWKGHELLAQAVARLKGEFPQLVVLVAGTGPREEELRGQISQLGISDSFRLLGFRSDVKELLAASDIFILPSFSEAFPISILEAMAAGLPVVVSNIGGIPEQVQDRVNGLLVEPGDVSVLTHALHILLSDELRRRRMGMEGRKKVVRFSLEKMIQGYLSVYREFPSRK